MKAKETFINDVIRKEGQENVTILRNLGQLWLFFHDEGWVEKSLEYRYVSYERPLKRTESHSVKLNHAWNNGIKLEISSDRII